MVPRDIILTRGTLVYGSSHAQTPKRRCGGSLRWMAPTGPVLCKHRVGYVGVWRGRTAGGSPKHSSFFDNPQLRLRISNRQQELRVTLAQSPLQPGAGVHAVGFVLLRADEPAVARRTLGTPGGTHGYSAIQGIHPIPFASGEERVDVVLKLERLKQDYILVPCTDSPGSEAAFALEIRSNYPLSLACLPKDGSPLPDPTAGGEQEQEQQQSTSTPAPSTAVEVHISSARGYGFGNVGQGGVSEGEALLQKLQAAQFEDDAFHSLLTGSAAGKAGREVEWRRPRQLTEEPSPVEAAGVTTLLHPELHERAGGAPPGPSAGSWILGALAMLAQSPTLLQRCFVPGVHGKRGVLAVRVWHWDSWHTILTDDRLPVASGRLVSGGCADARQLSLALLIKAYARHHGSYAALRTGRVTEMLVDFTGGCSQKIELGDDGEASAVWEELIEIRDRGALLGCQQLAGADRAVEAQRLGVRTQSTYVILELVELSGLRLVCLRNPFLEPRWRGKWRAGAPEWFEGGDTSPLLGLQESGSEHAGAAVAEDESGVFWLSLEDFVRVFDRAHACRTFSRSTPRALVFGEWDAGSAGGCLNYLCSWRRNPQYVLHLPCAARVFIAITQPPLLGSIGQRDYLSIGVCVLRGDGRRRLLTATRDSLLGASPISDTREVSFSLSLPASTAEAPHIVIPYTFEPNETGAFKLSVWADVKFGLSPLAQEDEWYHTALAGEWDASSGGVPNPGNSRWQVNPQWEVAPLSQPTTVTIVLELAPPPHPDQPTPLALGCLVLRGSKASQQVDLIGPDDVLAQAGFARAAQVTCCVTLPASDEPCCLLSCTFEPGQEAAFRLHLYTDQPISARAVQPDEVQSAPLGTSVAGSSFAIDSAAPEAIAGSQQPRTDNAGEAGESEAGGAEASERPRDVPTAQPPEEEEQEAADQDTGHGRATAASGGPLRLLKKLPWRPGTPKRRGARRRAAS